MEENLTMNSIEVNDDKEMCVINFKMNLNKNWATLWSYGECSSSCDCIRTTFIDFKTIYANFNSCLATVWFDQFVRSICWLFFSRLAFFSFSHYFSSTVLCLLLLLLRPLSESA